MRQLRATLLLGIVMVIGMVGVMASLHGAERVQALTDCTAPADVNIPIEQQFLDLMNEARAQAGAVALKISPNLQRAALWKSADSSAVGSAFSHTDSLGRNTVNTPRNRAIECGYATWAAEDIGWGYGTAQAMFDGFMASPRHRENILAPSAVVAGVALVNNGGMPAWTVDFGTVDDSTTGTFPAGQDDTSTPSTATSTPTRTATPSPTATPTRTPPPAHSLALNAGINLVTFEGPTTPVTTAVSGLGDGLIAVYAWQADSQTWAAYFQGAPGYANSLALLAPGQAYYLIMQSGMTWGY